MRVALVGSREARARLRARLPPSFEVAAEYSTLAGAREAAPDVDALVVAPDLEEGARAPVPPGSAIAEHPPRARAAAVPSWPGEEFVAQESTVEALTAREMDVLTLMAQGLTNKTIAARLGISDQTVKFHVASISGKLGAANRTDAVRRAVRRGLLTL